jgi:hypothetical protein
VVASLLWPTESTKPTTVLVSIPNHCFAHSTCFYQILLARRSLKHWQRVCFRVEYPLIEGQRILVQTKQVRVLEPAPADRAFPSGKNSGDADLAHVSARNQLGISSKCVGLVAPAFWILANPCFTRACFSMASNMAHP